MKQFKTKSAQFQAVGPFKEPERQVAPVGGSAPPPVPREATPVQHDPAVSDSIGTDATPMMLAGSNGNGDVLPVAAASIQAPEPTIENEGRSVMCGSTACSQPCSGPNAWGSSRILM
jgi:hypothetical protein